MKKSQIRCIVGNSMVIIASILTLCFYCLNLIDGTGRNQIYDAITKISKLTGPNIAYYITANAFFIVTLILSIIMLILGILGLFGGIFDIKGLNMTVANRALSIINLISAAMALIFMIVYVAALNLRALTIGAGPITVFLASIMAVVGAFVAQTRRIYRNN